ncbi:MAG: error-prone DNA polymerase [Pseudomonadota bacterium]
MTDYTELQVTSNFSFLRGGSHPDELMLAAAALGLKAIAVTDRNTLAGVVRAHTAAKRANVRLIPGCRLDLRDGPSLLCLPTDRAAYGRLSRLLTLGKRRAEKGECDLDLSDVYAHAKGQIFILIPPETWEDDDFSVEVTEIAGQLDAPCYLAAHTLYRGDDKARINRLAVIAEKAGIPMVATGDVHYHHPARRPLQDVLTCIREHCTIHEAGRRLHANAERHLKPADEMARLFAGHEQALDRTVEIADACRFSLDDLSYNYPDEPVPPDKTPQGHLEDLTWAGAERRFPDGIPRKVRETLVKELAIIKQRDYAPYFLTVHDIVRWARDQGILCQGRGSAANSSVCFCLWITEVNPIEIDLLFERFISDARDEPPDIDVDFEHERREEVMQYIYRRYGRERAGIAATVISYRSRSAVREVGKAMGLTDDVTGALAGMVWGWSEADMPDAHVREAGLDPTDPVLRRTLELTTELIGFPRHLSQHVGGFVLTQDPLCEVVPIGNAAMDDRTFVEWDKDDLDALNILKVDVLSLGMLTCLARCFALARQHYGFNYTLAGFHPMTDKATYDMLQQGDSIGVFQVESRAQMNMLPRLKPKDFYDLVIEVAIVRPGPIQGDMVHPYLRRRDELEPVEYPSPSPEHGKSDELRRILEKTLGVPIFQEQAMRIAIEAAKFDAEEANDLRYAMATFRRRGTIEQLEEKMVGRMIERGYDPDFAARCFSQIKGFGEYGFPESHAASFALLVYVSSWLKCHYPEVFACGILNSQPMGFYAPAQLVRDAREHGVEVRPVDINHSDWDCTLEPTDGKRCAVRLGLREVDGLSEEIGRQIEEARDTAYPDLPTLWRRAGVPVAGLERLAAADAFGSLGLDRRQALWEVSAIKAAAPLPLFAHADAKEEADEASVTLPAMHLSEQVMIDYQTQRLSLKAHPMSFLRSYFAARGITANSDLMQMKDGQRVSVAGLVLVRQRPGTAKGVIFATLEDETGVANAVVWQHVFQKHRKVVMGSRLILIHGKVQRHENIIHVVADRLQDMSGLLTTLMAGQPPSANDQPETGSARPPPSLRKHPRNVRIVPKSRDFH